MSQGLDTYRSRRDFARSPEPAGAAAASSRWKKRDNPIFVVQQHDASRMHWDFRLELDGVLKSWAVPKGPSTDPRDKRLAVETEDHPLEYADFEGVIPEGEYGGGAVIVWDAGPYRNLRAGDDGEGPSMAQAHAEGRIEVWLEGKKIRGGWALIHGKMGGKPENWLLIKMKDEAADARRDPVRTEPQSVISGRTVAQLAGDAAR